MSSIAEFQKKIGYSFKDESLLVLALTHTSYANENREEVEGHNQRLEFLGDSVLSLAVADELYHRFAQYFEGDLTRVRASLVCEKALYQMALEIDLGDYLLLGKGEEMSGGRTRPSVLSDAYEAVIAAIYLDGGMDAARKFILPRAQSHLEHRDTDPSRDYKSELQELIQQNPGERITYVLTDEKGPEHNKQFTIEVMLNSNRIGTGVAYSKKEAEQRAAREALRLMGK